MGVFSSSPRIHDVGKMEPIPGGMLKEPVSSGAVINENHRRNRYSSEGVQRVQPLLFRASLFLRLFVQVELVLILLFFLKADDSWQ